MLSSDMSIVFSLVVMFREDLLAKEKELQARISAGDTDPELNNQLTAVFNQLQVIESDKAPARAAVILAGSCSDTETEF